LISAEFPCILANVKAYLVLALIIAAFVAHSVSLSFTQDDAFISYRYVRNFLAGEGLVFNPGERVEGYTNFLWIIILAAITKLGGDMILASKILGVASGCAALILLYMLSVVLLRAMPALKDSGKGNRFHWLLPLLPPALLASNGAFAYWSISGLETSFFVAAVLLSAYLYLTGRALAVLAAALATLIRPEGALVFAVIVGHMLLAGSGSTRGRLKACLGYVAGFAVLTAPFLVFRILYYHDIFPNPFYAKTGLSIEYVKSGLAYFWLFLREYGLWGAVYLMPLAFYRKLGTKGTFVLAVLYVYTLYVILIGGDVLRANRFFLPIAPFAYIGFVLGVASLYSRLGRQNLRTLLLALTTAGFASVTFFVPRASLLYIRMAETSLSSKMEGYATCLKQAFGNDFTLAATTIGVVSYVTDVRVIDMLGLTDRYIAKHPENVPGIASTWRERTFNTRYVLSQNPDVILFSTGMRPSAPAEKALFLSSEFRQNYYTYYLGKILGAVYKRKGPYAKEDVLYHDPAFVDLFSEALYLAYKVSNFPAAVDKIEEVVQIGPKDFARAYECLGTFQFHLGNTGGAETSARKAVDIDDYSVEAHHLLETLYRARGDTASAMRERARVLAIDPQRYDRPSPTPD
jgi:tetratricopeptide (TPR) repeat protein